MKNFYLTVSLMLTLLFTANANSAEKLNRVDANNYLLILDSTYGAYSTNLKGVKVGEIINNADLRIINEINYDDDGLIIDFVHNDSDGKVHIQITEEKTGWIQQLYDNESRLLETKTYFTDSSGRITNTINNDEFYSQYTYNRDGNPIKEDFWPSRMQTLYQYSDDGKMLGWEMLYPEEFAARLIISTKMDYDDSRKLIKVVLTFNLKGNFSTTHVMTPQRTDQYGNWIEYTTVTTYSNSDKESISRYISMLTYR